MTNARSDPRDVSVEQLVPKLRAAGFELPPGTVRVDGFGDSEEASRRLLDEIRSGRKRSGLALAWANEADGVQSPAAGDLEIVVDHRNEPALVLRFTEVSVIPARALPAELAARRPVLEREGARIGREPGDDMPVVCARFELLFAMP